MIFGKKQRSIVLGQGRFYCPECRATTDYVKKEKQIVSVFFTFTRFPIEVLGQYIECNRCRNSFRENVLESSPETARAEFHPSMKRVMILMILSDGEINDIETRSIKDIYEKVSGNTISDEELAADIAKARKDGSTVAEYLKRVTPYLNKYGKEQVLKSAFYVATSDGVFRSEERALLDDIAQALEMLSDHYSALMKELVQEKEGIVDPEITSTLVPSL